MSKEKIEEIKSKYKNCEDKFHAACCDIYNLQGMLKRASERLEDAEEVMRIQLILGEEMYRYKEYMERKIKRVREEYLRKYGESDE